MRPGPETRASERTAPPPIAPTGFWLYTLHLATVWGLALSNALSGLTLLWVGARWPAIRRTRAEWQASGMLALMRPLAMYCLVLLASIATSYRFGDSLVGAREILSLTTLPLAFLLVCGERRTRRVLDVLQIVTVMVALHGIGQYLFTDLGGLENRIRASFSHYMTYSGILLLGACICIGRWMASERDRLAVHVGSLITILVALGLSLTRHAWLAALVTLTIAFVVRFRRWLPAYAAGLGVLLFMVSQVAPGHWDRVTSIGSLSNPSNYDRLCMADAGLHMIADRPLLGIGPEMVEPYYPIYRHPTAPRAEVAHLHNTLLQLGAERGLLSVVSYLWLMIAALVLALRGLRSGGGIQGPRADLYFVSILAIIAFNVAGIFEANWRDTEVQRWMLFLLAIPACVSAREQTDDLSSS